ncbi:hypothetical protein FB566_0594 [Stackebrandtia endophytica]|uniref:Uncharacterized protein n=1 Tax=Stackebrandtia endophytica TaxID=1496996 RepID=A0A543AR98_9ACTN|nr:RICIN domain-containing protein [Stackebrandtia endophytica]TQL75102.1 hypothetical protein FB566_0594 [Stackebrandtia endophytica]
MTGNWSEDKPPTPERIKNGARSTVSSVGSSKTAVIIIVVVAVVLIGTLVWSTAQMGGTDEAAVETPSDEAASPEPELTELPTDGTYQIHQGDDECLRVSDSDDGFNRKVLARGGCDGDLTRFELTVVDEAVVTIGFVAEEYADQCVQVDGPGPDEEPGIFYYAPADCDPDEARQRFTLLAGYYGTVRIQSPAEQCMDVYTDYEFADGKVVATANCSDSATQPLRFRRL